MNAEPAGRRLDELHVFDDPPLRADARRNRARVIAAALDIFAEHGAIDSMEQVAEAAGVAKSTVYRSFPNRGGLIAAVTARQFIDLEALARRFLDQDGDPVDSFVEMIREMMAYIGANGLLVEVQAQHELTEQLRMLREDLRLTLAVFMDRCRPFGVIRPDITPADLFLMMGGLCLRLHRERARAEQWRRAADLLLMALGYPVERVLVEAD